MYGVDIENLSSSIFYELIKQIHFAPVLEHDLQQLFFEYKLLWRFACKLAEESSPNTKPPNAFNLTYLKQFVLNNKEICPVLYIFCHILSFGSTIDYLNKIKRNVFESTDTSETGAVHKLAFIKQNGQPPGLKSNTKFLKEALTLMFKGNYQKQYIHSGQNLKATT